METAPPMQQRDTRSLKRPK